MENFKKAEEFYLRGFGSEYIKRRTGVSMQKLLKHLLKQGVSYTKSDIVNYQIDYIRNHYSLDEIKAGYELISKKYPNLETAARGRHIECLGCGFGQYPVVFRALLGEDVYKELRVRCWKEKQTNVMKQTYGVANAFEKQSRFLISNPMHSEDCKEKRRKTMLERYGCEHPNQNPTIKQQMMQTMIATNLERYGVENPMQNADIARKSAENRQLSMIATYGAGNSVQIAEIRNRIFDARRNNGTLNSSVAEDVLYEMLVSYFGKEDVLRNVCVDNRYPYHVDFYILSRDLFIELNGDRAHNTHWFDITDERDIQILQSWEENCKRIESETGKKSRYRKYIETWTKHDVEKRQCARKNQLNYLVFWDGSRKVQRNKMQFPRLQDANDWFEAGCPDSKDWRLENTY